MADAAPVTEPTEADLALARAALLEITPAATVGDPIGALSSEDGVLTIYFANTLPGYPGWRWTVSIARVDGEEPSVLETELTPGDGALLSPEWVPWADRLADYRAAQEEAGESADSESEADDDDDDDEDDLGSDVLHSGDLDGVDIDDELDDHIGDDDDLVEDGSDEDEPEGSAATAESGSASAVSELGVDEADDAEHDSGDAAPEPPDASGLGERDHEEEQNDESDHPEP